MDAAFRFHEFFDGEPLAMNFAVAQAKARNLILRIQLQNLA
jgi:hypothetical protein